MPETIAVDGTEATVEDLSDDGWITAYGNRRRHNQMKNTAPPSGAECEVATEKKGRYNHTPSTFQRVVVGSRLPRMPEDHFRVIVRPKGGLNVSRVDHFALSKSLIMAAALTDKQAEQDSVYPNKTQNIIVISTPIIANAKAYAGVRRIHTSYGASEVSAYGAAPENTCKGVLRNIGPLTTDQQLDEAILNSRNPTAIGVKRIKNTRAVIVLFEVGHRADVCHKSTEEKEKCHNCRLSIPSDTRETNSCTPKCKLCGGAHITGDRSCKKRYHVPYIVRKRRRDRRSRSRADPEEDTGAAMMRGAPARSRSRGRSRQRGGTRGPARSQSRSRSRSKAKLTWADKVRGGSGSSGGNIGEAGPSPRPSTLPPAIVSTQRNAHKRRAVAAVSDEGEDDLSDGMSDISEAPSNVSAVEGTSTSRCDKRRNTTYNTISANDQLYTRNPQNKHQLQQQEPLYPVREQ
ncbi:hypothetical protein HPB52_013458 [Rhipicephalus sanguineus]|uniref:Uncharacterized protein n=1 Tax=Rhipicephalus sanguineus TaxID=34632 RepID=A0A9D4SMU5_RHISA|nr:hypothetical protein HPB52_013458 [Rhipicephalus sanguineus]